MRFMRILSVKSGNASKHLCQADRVRGKPLADKVSNPLPD
jgi:hypothetical protein